MRQKKKGKQQLRIYRNIGIVAVLLFALIGWIQFSGKAEGEIVDQFSISSISSDCASPNNASENNVIKDTLADEEENAELNSLQSKQTSKEKEQDAGQSDENPSADDWSLLLVNPWNALPDDYDISLTTVYGSYQVDSRCYDALIEMLDDCEAAGYSPLICSAYRSTKRQQELYEEQAQKLKNQGYSTSDAYEKAATSVAYPGTSEHQLGLAVDLVDASYQMLDTKQEDTPVQQWLMENSWKYGFILRYPTDKSDITGIIYEPWHYRYVGKDAAREIYEQGICLEEYLEQ
jgi:D-alanyl-D-alanine carboxypeptidase